MDLRTERFTALVLRALPYGESDQVVQMLARGRGRIAVFARGARSSKRRFGGALEPFQLCEILVSTTRACATICTGWHTRATPRSWRTS